MSGNQYMHLEKGNSEANLAPDVYIIPDERMGVKELFRCDPYGVGRHIA